MNDPVKIKVTGAVMVHPRRLDTARVLVDSVRPGFLDMVFDPQPDEPVSLRTPMLAWSSIPERSTHHVVLEDDAILAAGFVEHAERMAVAAPDAAIAFYTNWNSRNGAAVRLGALARARWANATAEYTPTVALMLPAQIGAGFASYAREHGGTWPDDVVMARYLESRHVQTLLTVPNLVQHGDLPSLSGNDSHGLRLAACFAPPPDDADWNVQNTVSADAVPFFEYGTARCAIRYPPEGRFLTVGPTRFLPRIGVDTVDCQRSFAETLAIQPAIGGTVCLPVLEEFWQVGYLLGFVGRQADQALELSELLAAWAADPLVDAALASLGPGGLCTSHDAATLERLGPDMREFAQRALHCGARASDHAAVPGRRQPPRRETMFLSPAGHPFGGCLAADLADRGYEIGDRLEDVHAVVHVTETAGDDHHDLVRQAQAAGVARVVIVAVSNGPPEVSQPRTGDPLVHRLAVGIPYGPGVNGYSPVNRLVDQALRRQPMTVPADTPDIYHLAHVWDVANVLDQVLSSGIHQPPAAVVSLPQLAEVIAEVVNRVDIRVPDVTSVHPATPTANGVVPLAVGIRSVAQWLAYEAEGMA